MRRNQLITYLLIFALVCTALPTHSPPAQAVAALQATHPSVTKQELRSNMRIAAPPQLTDFPGACTPRERNGDNPLANHRVWLPLVSSNRPAVVAADLPSTQPTVAKSASALDPSLTATPLTGDISFAESVAFLYRGDQPVQTGVAAGALDPDQAAVVHGKVLSQNGEPLAGVKIQVFGQSAYGQTLSRNDGLFDMAVNAGPLTLCFDLPGYLPTQRPLNATWDDFTVVDDVVLLPMDNAVSTIDLSNNNAIQVAQGSPISDDDGARQATLLFTPNTGAELVLADGSTRTLTTLSVRATEFTVGERGALAMPGALPFASGYTYAVEFTVDEALSAGAVDVRFTKPVINYVENFLDFPVGSAVPTGYYDRGRSAWVPSDNGRVIRILAINDGLATLAVESSGESASAQQLAELGIDQAEQRTLAELYPAGQSLWRVPIPHFTPWDHNWPYGPPEDATSPNSPYPQADNHQPDPCVRSGSIIECQNQTLGERVSLAGTAFSLNYRSSRVPAREMSRLVGIPLSGNSVPTSLQQIVLETEIAGQRVRRSFAPAPNQLFMFHWDGIDGFGRSVPNLRKLTVRLGFVYPAIYRTPGEQFQRSFARFGGTQISSDGERGEIAIWRTWETYLHGKPWDARTQALGGWTLSPHHAYNIATRTLYRGDGTQPASDGGRVLRTVAGTRNSVGAPVVDGALATDVTISSPFDIAASADGTFYVSSRGCIYKINNQGKIYRVTRGPGNSCLVAVEGFDALIGLNPFGISLAPNGDLYVVNHGDNGRGAGVLRFRADGAVFWVAGNGKVGFAGDGGPATAATLGIPMDVAVAPDGSFYIAESYNQRVRHVGTDGIITTVAGGGEPADGLGDGGLATSAKLGGVRNVAVDQNGVLYIGHDPQAGTGVRVRRVGSNGIITTVVGGGSQYDKEGELGTDTALNTLVRSLTIGLDNQLYLDDLHRIRTLGQDGRMTTVAGTTEYGYSEDGTPVDEAKLAYAVVAFLPNGAMLLAEQNNSLVRLVNPILSQLVADEVIVPDEQSAEYYIFDRAGRHQRTVDMLTGVTRYSFGYDQEQRLVTITDGSGNRTRIERNGDGTPTAIVAPFGQRTTLIVNEHGYLTEVTNPINARHRMSYHDAKGLLATFTDPNGNISRFSYDERGRLRRDSFATGGSWTLDQQSTLTGISTTTSSALSRTLTLALEDVSLSSTRQVVTFPDQSQTVVTSTANGDYQVQYANGARVSSDFQPDGDHGFTLLFESSTVRFPSGLETQLNFARTHQFTVATDPLSGLAVLTSSLRVNNQVSISIYDGASKTTTNRSAAGRQSIVRYDTHGRIVEQGGNGLASTIYNYNERGLLTGIQIGTGSAARVYAIEYDNKGELQALTSPLGQRNHLTVDAVGQVISHTRPDGAVTSFGYDANGNLLSITPPGRSAHTYTYNAQNQIASYTPPVVGATGSATTYDYNLDGQLTTVTRPDGSRVSVDYDSGGRAGQVELARGLIRYGYDAISGQLNQITAPDGGVLSYQHDGPLLTESRWRGTVSGVVRRAYDPFRRVTRLDVGNQLIAYTYDRDGLVTQAGELQLRYEEGGLPVGDTLRNIATTHTYNEFGELTNHLATVNNNSLYATTYTRDNVGRIIRKVEVIEGRTVTFDYVYNEIGRLRQVQQDGVVIAAYSYDANGNRLSGQGGATASYDEQDRMVSYGNATYTYNLAGDLLTNTEAGQTTTYTYDELSNLLSVDLPDGRAVGYIIDGNNRRIGKRVDGQLRQGFLYQDQLRVVAELDGNNNLVSRFVYADNSTTPAYMTRNGVTYRLLSDYLGSVRLVVNVGTGAIVQRLEYDAFGMVLVDTNPGFQPFGFAGGLYDPDTKLVRFGKRDYDAQSGRWTTKDPIGMAGGDTNLYLYVGGDPINLTDESGELFFLAGVVATILLLSLMALPLAIKILKRLVPPIPPDNRPVSGGGAPPPRPCNPSQPPEPVPSPQPEPEPAQEPEPDPLPEFSTMEIQPEPPVMEQPDYEWAISGSPPPCPSPAIRPPCGGGFAVETVLIPRCSHRKGESSRA